MGETYCFRQLMVCIVYRQAAIPRPAGHSAVIMKAMQLPSASLVLGTYPLHASA